MIVRGFIMLLGALVAVWALLRLLIWARSATDGSSGPIRTLKTNPVPTAIGQMVDALGGSGQSQRFLSPEVKPLAIEDTARTLMQLQELVDSGLITSDEYDAKKAEILNRM